MGFDGGYSIFNTDTGDLKIFDNYKGCQSVEFAVKRDPITGRFPIILVRFWLDRGIGTGLEMLGRVSAPKYDQLFVQDEFCGPTCEISSGEESSEIEDSEEDQDSEEKDFDILFGRDTAEVKFDGNSYEEISSCGEIALRVELYYHGEPVGGECSGKFEW